MLLDTSQPTPLSNLCSIALSLAPAFISCDIMDQLCFSYTKHKGHMRMNSGVVQLNVLNKQSI